jgi:branched-chain amino acid aminotransferase
MAYLLNGEIYSGKTLETALSNRGLNYGDGIFETIKYAFGRYNFWEDHYFRLMESMRIVRMEIPMSFSPEFLEAEFKRVLQANGLEAGGARLKILVTRQAGGFYTPQANTIDYLITAEPIENRAFQLNKEGLKIDLFKDHFKSKSLLSNLKSTSAQLYTVAAVYRQENNFDECLLINENKEIVEAISSNVFLIEGKTLITPPLSSGCLKGVIRKNILKIAPSLGFEVKEETFSPFKLQKVDEVFLTNSIKGIEWVEQYRKKEFGNQHTQKLAQRLNTELALNSN